MPQTQPEIFVPGESEKNQINAIRQARQESDMASRTRKRKNDMNMASYLGNHDWSHKKRGQSKVSIPKTAVSVETFAAFIKRALVALGDWFSVDAPESGILRPPQIMALMNCFLDNLADGMRDQTPFGVRMSDATKVGLLKALIILKVHGFHQPRQVFVAERGTPLVQSNPGEISRIVPQNTGSVKKKTQWIWRLAIDLVDPDDYKPDPTGRKLYEVHRVKRDLHDVIALAKEDGIYDPKVVNQIVTDFDDAEEVRRKARNRNQDTTIAPGFRREILIEEYWGDMLDKDGKIKERNILAVLANDKYLIRPSEPNPTAHGESPFCAAPLLRVPFSVWHKALYDHASPLNSDLNEIISLMLDW